MKRIAWDEYVGLDSAVLQAGARAVIGSVWMAMDRSAALLMYIFYRQLRLGLESPRALAQAQRSLSQGSWKTDGTLEEFNRSFTAIGEKAAIGPLRREEDYSHPFFWSNFRHLG